MQNIEQTERPIDRLAKLLEVNSIKHYSFEKTIKIANGYVKKQQDGKGSIGSEVLEKIRNNYPDWDILWILFGDVTPSASKENHYKKPEFSEGKPSDTKANRYKKPPPIVPSEERIADVLHEIKGLYYIHDNEEKPSEGKKITKRIYKITPIEEGDIGNEEIQVIDKSRISPAATAADVLSILQEWMFRVENDIDFLKKRP